MCRFSDAGNDEMRVALRRLASERRQGNKPARAGVRFARSGASLPPLPQQVEDLGRQHHVSVLAALRLHDADDHLRTGDVAHPQSHHLAGPVRLDA
jgi:hypothetical protein